jgi:hypothetical protein
MLWLFKKHPVQAIYKIVFNLQGRAFRLRLALFLLSSTLSVLLPPISGASSQSQIISNHNSQQIEIFNRFSNIEIKNWSESHIQITRTGPAKQVANATIQQRGNTVVLEDPASPPIIIEKDGKIHSRVEYQSIQIAPGGRLEVDETVILGSDLPPPLHWLIMVPDHKVVTVKNLDGHLKADVFHGLVMDVGGGDVEIQHCWDCRIKLDGPGEVDLKHAAGRLFIKHTGTGDISIRKAELSHLQVQAGGSGDIQIGGKIQKAKITMGGAGDISLETVVYSPVIINRGVGEVEIENSLWALER